MASPSSSSVVISPEKVKTCSAKRNTVVSNRWFLPRENWFLKKKTMGKSMKTSIKQFYLITVYVEKWITENYDRLMGLPFTSQISGVSATSLTISGLKVNRRSPWQWSFVLGSCTKEGLGHVSKGICVWAIVCNSFWELLYVSAWLHQKLPGSSGSPLLLKHQIMPCAAPWWFWLRGAK